MSGSVDLTNGVAVNKDLTMKSPLLRVIEDGKINIHQETIVYLLTANVVGTLKGQEGKSLEQLGNQQEKSGESVPSNAEDALRGILFCPDGNNRFRRYYYGHRSKNPVSELHDSAAIFTADGLLFKKSGWDGVI